MAWYMLYKWFRPWSKRKFINVNRSYSKHLDPVNWERMERKNSRDTKTAMMQLLAIHDILSANVDSPYNKILENR